jgi:hypothetical protein
MKRLATGIAAVALLAGIGLSAHGAAAASGNTTSLSLACDHATTSATVSLTLQASQTSTTDLAAYTLACGTGQQHLREVVSPTFPVGWVTITAFSGTTTTTTFDCPPGTGGTLPFKFACQDTNGTGATLTVR